MSFFSTKKKIIIAAAAIIAAAVGCYFMFKKDNRFDVDTSKINLQVKIERFDQDIYHTDTTRINEEIARFRQKYGEFFDVYSQGVMEFGNPEDEEFALTFKAFLRDSVFHDVYTESLQVFDDVSDIEKKLTDAFRRVKHHFPNKRIPRVLMHVSGFNQSVVTTDSVLSISIDNYLGKDYALYSNLVFRYQLTGMVPEKVPSDYMTGWLLSEFPMQKPTERLLDNILYRGKIMFTLEKLMPNEDECLLMTYTPEQMKWCYDNERQMWTYMMEEKHLFKSERMISAKYINEAPSTAFFPDESPGRTGIWIGWQIIRSYMKNNPSVSLAQLMDNENYQEILEKSGYRP